MTREEREKVIDLLDNLIGVMEDNQGNDYDFALKKGIEALKQGDAIDKIKAEIEQRPYGVANDSVIQGMKYERIAIFEIFDKYKRESEE